MVKEVTMSCEDVIEYVKKNVDVYDNVEFSYNCVYTPGEVINIDHCVLKDGRKVCSVMVQLAGDILSNTVDVDLEEIKDDLIEVKHIPQDGEEILITVDTCEEDEN